MAGFAVEQLRRSWTQRLHRLDGHEDESRPDALYRQLRQDLLAVESTELDRLHRTGAITERTQRRIQRVLALQLAGLHDDDP